MPSNPARFAVLNEVLGKVFGKISGEATLVPSFPKFVVHLPHPLARTSESQGH